MPWEAGGGADYGSHLEISLPTRAEPVAFSRIPNNLGYCIKAEKLLAFEEHFERLLKAEKTAKESGDIGSGPEAA